MIAENIIIVLNVGGYFGRMHAESSTAITGRVVEEKVVRMEKTT